ncbi:MAG: DUF1559 domain-containing protein [Pirellulales bacterium]|nr:DUF1559 domain-containing protein [Pirellulales bacterium]
MVTTAVGSLGLLMLLFLGSFSGLPMAGPPQPLDPALSAVAPPQCMWYSASAGIARPDPNSANETEQLFAEPEVQHFLGVVEEELLRALRRNVGSGWEQRVAGAEAPKLIKAFLTLPFVIYVEDVQVTAEGVNVQAGLVLSAGEQRATLQDTISSLLALKGDQGPPINPVDQNGESWSSIKIAPQVPEIRWGWQENYFILAVGEGTADAILERMPGSAPEWLKELRREHPVARESSVGYLNIEVILERVRPFLEQHDAWQYVEKLGLTRIKAAHGIAGFDEKGCVTKSHLVTDGERRGLLAFLPYKPLSERDLRTIPHDAMVAMAVRLDGSEVWDEVIRLVGEFEPRAAEQVERGLWSAEKELGVNLKDDVLDALGDVWIAYLPAGDLMTSWLGGAAAVRVKDAEQLKASLDRLIAVAQANLPHGRRRGVTLRTTEFEGHTIHFLNVVGEPFLLAPAWCVTDEWLVFGLMPQTVRTVISRQLEESLADVDEIREILSADDAPAVVSYFDTPRLVRSVYPLLQIGGQILSAELQKEGVDLDVSILPAQETLVKHLRPGVGAMAHHSDGFHFHSQTSLPGSGNAVAVAPLMGAALFPAAQGARQAAQRNQELNNLKLLALAFLNYADARGHMITNVYADNGEPLLSWRVQLLPYLEQQALYDQFHLDEPWDSPHNIKLAKAMPECFVTPSNRKLAAEGKTRYVALAGEETLFPGNREIGFIDVRDGTSNTIMLVRAARDAAVPWTKPADIEFDADQPLRGIKSTEGRFAVAFCDGSCHWLRMSLSEKTVRALATRNGGEVVHPRDKAFAR